MAIIDEQRSRLAELTMRAFDNIAQEYGENAELGDAVLCYEVLIPEDDDDGYLTHGCYHSTAKKASTSVGILTLSLKSMTELADEDEA